MIADYLSASPRNPTPALFIGALALAAGLGANIAGLLRIPNGVLYDLAVRYSPAEALQSNQVLVVTGNPSELKLHAAPWLKTLQILEQLGAKQVVFTFVPENTGRGFFSAAEVRGKVVFGRRTESAGNGERLVPWPPAAESSALPFGVVRIPPAVYGVHRTQAHVHAGDFGRYPDLALIAAQRFLERRSGFPENIYMVNFLGGLERLPHVSLKRLLAGGLIPELVRNRTVVVGLNDEVGLHTPITSSDAMMPLPVYQAYALDTLIEGRWIRTTPLWVTAIMLAWVSLISVVAYQWTGVRLASWLTGTLIVIYVASAWLLLSYAWVWPPVMELFIVQTVCFLLITRHRTLANEQAFRQILLVTSTRLKERVITRDFYEVEDPWPQLIQFVQNILDLDRSIFMERYAKQNFVRVGAGYQCTEDDIHEQRRDYRREPYSTAIAENRPIPLTRTFLKVRESEDQYLVPLRHGNEILGFWAFGVETAKAKEMPRFLAVADQFSTEIGRLLFQRSQWQASRQSESAVVSRYLRLEGGAVAGGPFSETVHQLVRRMEALEWILNGVETPIAAYDIFGQIMHINEAMSELLSTHEVRFHDMGALDLLAALSAKDTDYARSVFQHVALGGEPISLIASLGGEDERFLLHIAPLARARAGEDDTGESVDRQGMIFQLTDISPLQAPIEMREESLQRVIARLRNDMESMMLAKSLLDDEKQPKTALAQAVNILKAKIEETVTMMDQAQRYMAEDDVDRLVCYPIDPIAPLRTAISTIQGAAGQRQVTVSQSVPQLISLVLAQPDELTGILTVVLNTLVEDAMDDTSIKVILEERDGRIQYRFANQGFGIPNDRFQSYLTGAGEVTALEFQALRHAMRQVEHWEGHFEAASEVGTGMRFTIDLKSFLGMGANSARAPETTVKDS